MNRGDVVIQLFNLVYSFIEGNHVTMPQFDVGSYPVADEEATLTIQEARNTVNILDNIEILTKAGNYNEATDIIMQTMDLLRDHPDIPLPTPDEVYSQSQSVPSPPGSAEMPISVDAGDSDSDTGFDFGQWDVASQDDVVTIQ